MAELTCLDPNIGAWIRGDALDYDERVPLVRDNRWNRNSLLPFFRQTEHHHDSDSSREQHDFDGPVYTTPVIKDGCKYLLRDTLHQAWKSPGLERIPDLEKGHPLGIAEEVSCRRDGSRPLPNLVYPLGGATFKTNTNVSRIILKDTHQKKTAIGIELADHSRCRIKAGGEVILCAGVFGSPQSLILPGICDKGPPQKHNISRQADLPWVGKNLPDHQGIVRFWKLRQQEKGRSHGPLHSPIQHSRKEAPRTG